MELIMKESLIKVKLMEKEREGTMMDQFTKENLRWEKEMVMEKCSILRLVNGTKVTGY
jgi:hypothetical protein